jgi:predicted Rossmann fold nucleotide-binding protein DprA/Smf involved in DNA uptake
MAFYLIGAKPWTPDRTTSPGPCLKPAPPPGQRKSSAASPALRRKVLAALERGPATGEEIALMTHCNIHSVHAKLSRLHCEGILDRAPNARSPHNGRLVQVYKLK